MLSLYCSLYNVLCSTVVTEGVHYYGFRCAMVSCTLLLACITFRHGLSNSIYCPPHNIDVHGEDQVSSVYSCYGDLG